MALFLKFSCLFDRKIDLWRSTYLRSFVAMGLKMAGLHDKFPERGWTPYFVVMMKYCKECYTTNSPQGDGNPTNWDAYCAKILSAGYTTNSPQGDGNATVGAVTQTNTSKELHDQFPARGWKRSFVFFTM